MPAAAIVVFARAELGERLVAGVPAAARVAREVRLAGLTVCHFVAGADWAPGRHLKSEIARLAGGLEIDFQTVDRLEAESNGPILVLDGTAIPDRSGILALIAGGGKEPMGHIACGDAVQSSCAMLMLQQTDAVSRLDGAGKAVLRATAKPGDGIVSRSINRPISRAISASMLRFPGIRPLHATFGTAALAIAMVIGLTSGTRSGQIWGALLFQAASIFDGVDGEIARATFRTSRSGAMLDSVIDALTNLSFVLGLAVNLAIQGETRSAGAGFVGLCVLALGLVLIGRLSARRGGPFTFDVIKDHYRTHSGGKPSRMMRAATFITSRDFFALVFVVMILAGFPGRILELFALAALLWLIAVVRAITAQQR